jgi:signal peptidase II
MAPARTLHVAAFAAVSVAVVVLDQLTKASARALLADGTVRALVPGVIDLRLVQNTGAAFSIGQGGSAVFALLALAIAGVALYYVAQTPDAGWPITVSLACVAGGGIGNMLDRILLGHVTDFLATSFVSFPVFNVADIFVTCGVVVSFVAYLRSSRADGGEAGEA